MKLFFHAKYQCNIAAYSLLNIPQFKKKTIKTIHDKKIPQHHFPHHETERYH